MSTTWDLQEKSGTATGGWEYNEHDMVCNQQLGPQSGNPVLYNGSGYTTTWTLQTKS